MKFPFTEIISYLKAIKEIGDQNKKILERIEQVQDKDRENIRELESRLGHLEVEVKSLVDTVSKIPNQTRDRVAEASESIIEEASNLKKAINEAEIVPVDKKTVEDKKKHWWDFRKGRG